MITYSTTGDNTTWDATRACTASLEGTVHAAANVLPCAARANEMTGERDHRGDDDDGGDDHDGLHANGRGREPVDDAGVVGHGVGGGRMNR